MAEREREREREVSPLSVAPRIRESGRARGDRLTDSRGTNPSEFLFLSLSLSLVSFFLPPPVASFGFRPSFFYVFTAYSGERDCQAYREAIRVEIVLLIRTRDISTDYEISARLSVL